MSAASAAMGAKGEKSNLKKELQHLQQWEQELFVNVKKELQEPPMKKVRIMDPKKSGESNASSASGLKPKKEEKRAESSAASASGRLPNVEAIVCWPDSD